MASIRWIDLHKYSLVWVEFGNNKNDIDTLDDTTYTYGLKDDRYAKAKYVLFFKI